MTTAEILSHFDGVERAKNGWTAQCPAHADNRPSLSISEGADGRTLLNCHAGCSPEDVTAAAGLAMSQLYPDSTTGRESGGKLGSPVAEYAYTDEAGELLYHSLRFRPKTFRPRRADGEWTLKGCRRALYRLPDVEAAVEAGRTVVVVEGEKDADNLAALGFTATTNIGGAGPGKWEREYTATLRGARVVIVPDNDEPGREHGEAVASELHGEAADVRVLELPGLPEKGDVSDWIDGGGTAEEFKALAREAPVWTPDAEDDDGPAARSLADILADPEAVKPPKVVVPKFAWAGRVTLLAAREKAGKSTTATAAAAAVSRGETFLDGTCKSGPVLWVGLEEHVSDIARRLKGFGADPETVWILTRVEDPAEDIAREAERVGAVFVVVDTLAEQAGLYTDRPDPGNATAWTQVMHANTRLARDSGAAVLLIHHARKSDGKYRDSTAIGAGVDVLQEMHESGPGVRKIKVRARWNVPDFKIAFHNNRFKLASTAGLELSAAVLRVVGNNPGCSTKDVRDGVAAKSTKVTAAVKGLLVSGDIEDRSEGRPRRALHVVETEPPHGGSSDPGLGSGPGGSSGWTPHGPATDQVSDQGGSSGRATHRVRPGPPSDDHRKEETETHDHDPSDRMTCPDCGAEIGPTAERCAKCVKGTNEDPRRKEARG